MMAASADQAINTAINGSGDKGRGGSMADPHRNGVPHKRSNTNMNMANNANTAAVADYNNVNYSQNSSINDAVAFNDSAYRLGLASQMTYGQSSKGAHAGHHTIANADDLNQMTYFLFRPLKLRKHTLTLLVTALLTMSLFMERFCFIVTVYKTRYYGYVLILIVILLNCIFNFALTRMRKKK